jgi:hypothetical protein
MREHHASWRLFIAVGLCAALSSDGATQDASRQLDVPLRDGPRAETKQVDILDPADVSTSVDESLPAPTHPVSKNLVVRHDGQQTGARVAPSKPPHAAGVIRPRGNDIDLKALTQMIGEYFDVN